ncbi:hypothetical protein KR018_006090 [Drosophila ironensis]|nr:hypothetical protein KR018_006090 [Drosophila ironensis]
MTYRFISILSILIVLVQGSQILPVEEDSLLEVRKAGGPSSGAAISFPTVRPHPTPQGSASSVGRKAAGGSRHGPNKQAGGLGSHRRPPAGANSGRPYGSIHPNRNRNQKPH